jgi:hypothetical protein
MVKKYSKARFNMNASSIHIIIHQFFFYTVFGTSDLAEREV